jgi:hypothetical protein
MILSSRSTDEHLRGIQAQDDQGERKRMLLTILLALFAGFMAGNGLPYYLTGHFGEEHRMPFGNSPTGNVVVGWVAFLLAGIAWYFVDTQSYPVLAYLCAAVGLLIVGLIHARVWQGNPPFELRLFHRK